MNRMNGLVAIACLAAAIGVASAWPAGAQEDPAICRSNCRENYEDCKQACVDARGFDACVADCRERYDDCLDTCR